SCVRTRCSREFDTTWGTGCAVWPPSRESDDHGITRHKLFNADILHKETPTMYLFLSERHRGPCQVGGVSPGVLHPKAILLEGTPFGGGRKEATAMGRAGNTKEGAPPASESGEGVTGVFPFPFLKRTYHNRVCQPKWHSPDEPKESCHVHNAPAMQIGAINAMDLSLTQSSPTGSMVYTAHAACGWRDILAELSRAELSS
ncbi:hypothetical protein BN1723_010620, partial [Verticillium longisporum]